MCRWLLSEIVADSNAYPDTTCLTRGDFSVKRLRINRIYNGAFPATSSLEMRVYVDDRGPDKAGSGDVGHDQRQSLQLPTKADQSALNGQVYSNPIGLVRPFPTPNYAYVGI
jgi:hypothetical protein